MHMHYSCMHMYYSYVHILFVYLHMHMAGPCRYGKAEFWGDLKQVYQICGVQDRAVAFMLTDSQIAEEGFLEDLSYILNSGEVPGKHTTPCVASSLWHHHCGIIIVASSLWHREARLHEKPGLFSRLNSVVSILCYVGHPLVSGQQDML